MARAKESKNAVRNRTIAAIHAGRRALRWDVETYREFLRQMAGGKESTSLLTEQEMARVLDGMRQRGFQRRDGSTSTMPRERATQLDKARALWSELAAIGALQNPSDVGFARYVERMTRRSRPEWCTPAQLATVIEGLKGWLKREDARRSDRGTPSE